MQLLLFLATLLGVAIAQSVSTTVNRVCLTRYALQSASTIRTVNLANTTRRPVVVSVTVTPETTITPSAVTSSVTSTRTILTTTTLPGRTNTYTTSVTMTTTQTDTEIENYIQTLTTSSTTTVQSTTTVAAPAGFTNLVNMPGYFPKRNAVVERREALQARGDVKGLLPVIPEADPQPTSPALIARQASTAGQGYPVAVTCTRRTTLLPTRFTTLTAATSTSTAPVPTSYITQTKTVTLTRTSMMADETRIITVSTDTVTSTSTSTSSTTEMQTSTFTVSIASATFLAQCEQNNIVNSAVGQKIGTISFNKAFTLQSLYTPDTTGYGCCAQCANTANCAGYAQAPNSGACYYLTTDGRCDVAQSWGDRFHYYNTNGDGYKVGNGQCGFLGPQAGKPVV